MKTKGFMTERERERDCVYMPSDNLFYKFSFVYHFLFLFVIEQQELIFYVDL